MTTSMQKHLSEIERIKQAEADKETALHAYAAKNKAITEQDPHEPFDYYYAEKLARPLIEEDLRRNQFYTLAERQTNAASRYVADNVESICSILRADLESRCKAKPIFARNPGLEIGRASCRERV